MVQFPARRSAVNHAAADQREAGPATHRVAAERRVLAQARERLGPHLPFVCGVETDVGVGQMQRIDADSGLAVLIGRFQPFHNGHLALLELALEAAPRVVVVIGSAFQARSPKHPFDWQERAQMIRSAVPESQRRRLLCVPVRDYFDETPTWTISGTTYLFEVDTTKRTAVASSVANTGFASIELQSVPADEGAQVSVAALSMTHEDSQEFHPRIRVRMEGKKNFFGMGKGRDCVIDRQAWDSTY